ncbi:MAG: hypothetical protein GY708_04150 [Actinomycetia bacterium]|nr:hypothetical protein [Actinomycetes bacterium]
MTTDFLARTELIEHRQGARHLIDAGRRWAKAHHNLIIGCADFADGPVWIVDCARSAAHWLAPRLDLEVCTVRNWIRVGRALRGLHASADAFQAGQISYAKTRAVIHNRHVASRSYETRTDPDGTTVTTIRQPAGDAAKLNAAVEAELMCTRPVREPSGD